MRKTKTPIYITSLFVIILFFAFPAYTAAEEVMVGSIAGELSATPSGAATYSIPIDCPQGVGIEPTLSLVYSSQGGKGIAGWGWNLAGLSAIIRTPKISYFEGSNASISWTKSAALSLNGQRLITERSWNTDSIEYRLESDPTTMVRAYSVQSWGPLYLKAFTKEGLTMTYGDPNRLPSYIVPYSELKVQSPSKMGWNLVKVEDANGNYMEIQYTNLLRIFNGTFVSYPDCESLVSIIRYGGNKRKGTTGSLTLIFDYDYRTDAVETYVKGKKMRQGFRLKTITTAVNNINQKIYSLSYDKTSSISRLQSIGLFNGEGKKTVDPLVFSYGKSNPDQGDVSIPRVYNYNNGTGASKNKIGLIALDLDGDGSCELGDVYYEWGTFGTDREVEYTYLDIHRKSNAWNTQERFSMGYLSQYEKGEPYNIFSDFNLNGSADRIVLSFTLNADMSLQAFDCATGANITQSNTVNLFINNNLNSLNSPFVCTGNTRGYAYGNILVILDEPVKSGSGTRIFYTYSYQLLSGTSEGKVSLTSDAVKTFTVPAKIEKASLIKFGTSNYRDDLYLLLDNGIVHVKVNTQDNDAPFSAGQAAEPKLNLTKDDPCKFGDMNGDGLIDIVCRTDDNQWKIAYNKGDYTFEVKDLPAVSCNKTFISDSDLAKYEEKDDVFLIDINQDGLTDLVFADEQLKVQTPAHPSYTSYIFSHTQWKFYLNTGQREEYVYQSPLTTNSSEGAAYACFGDLLGKGDVNWAYADALGNMKIKTFSFSRDPNLLTRITNPVSGETTLEYTPHTECDMDNSDRYTLQNYLTLKCHPFKTSLFKVFSGSNDGNIQIAYRYSTPLVNWGYRGFTGFRFNEKKDVKKNLWEVTEYTFPDQGKPYYLMLPFLKNTYGKKGNSTTIISSESYTYTVKSYNDYNNNATKRYAIRIATQNQIGYLAGEKTTKRNSYISYDAYNNVLESRTEGKGQVKYDKLIYQKSGAWCPNKLRYIEQTTTCASDGSSLQRISRFRYDPRGNMTESKIDSGHINMRHTCYNNYDYYGHPLWVSEEATSNERYTYITYTNSGRFVSNKTNLLNQTVSYVWDEQKGLLMSSTDRKGTTSYHYDDFNQIKSITYPTGTVETQETKWADSNSGFRYYTKQTRPDMPGNTVWTYYDKHGREAAKDTYDANNSGRVVRICTEYHLYGNIYRVSHPGYTDQTVQWATTCYYDDLKRLIKTITPEGSTTTVYSPSEDTIKVYKPDGITTTVWNAAAQVTKVITNGKAVEYTYTAGRRLKTATPEGGNSAWQMEYDLQGNLTKQISPDLGTIEYTYNGWGDLMWEKQSVHNSGPAIRTHYNYDAYGYLQAKSRNGKKTLYEYDSDLRLKKEFIGNEHSRTYEYDAYDRPIQIQERFHNKEYTTKKAYDTYGRVSTMSYPGGKYSITNHYDSYGYLKSVTDNSSHLVWRLDSCDAKGKVIKETKNNISTRYTYDEAGRILSIKAPPAINSQYTYYPTGNLRTYTDSISKQTETYRYDALDRLISWKTPDEDNYPFDNIEYENTANRISHKYDPIHNGHIYSYYSTGANALGSLTYSTSPIQSVTYTDFKKVKSVQQYSGESFNIDYGLNDQRISMFESQRYSERHYYVSNYYEEVAPSGESTTGIHYIYGGNGLAAIYKSSSYSDNFYSAYTDRQGSLVALMSENTVAKHYAYDPWGNRRDFNIWSRSPYLYENWIVNRGYTMHEHLDVFKLINMNGRFYEPYSGIFLSPDPYIQSPGNWLNYNRYAYCMNNPLKYTDPTGEFWMFMIGGALIGSYIGSSIKGGSWNPAKWSGNWWQGAIYGGLTGAAVGSLANAMWTNGASISFGVHAYATKSIELLSFSKAAAGGVTLTIGAGLGLGSTLSYTLSKKKDQKDMTPFDVGLEWLTGTGESDRIFGEGDYFTELLKEHHHLDKTREKIQGELSSGSLATGKIYTHSYKLNGLEGAKYYAQDYSTLVTFGQTGNLGATYLGSFRLNYKVQSMEKNSAVVQFEVNNSSTAASAMRPPVIGYTEFWHNNVTPIINDNYSTGPLSPTTQKFIWEETIKW